MRGVYVHIPFCSIKCYYCDFAAFAGQGRSADRYITALERELALWTGAADTLYIGGGTPSELTAVQLDRLLAVLESRLGLLSRLAECTIEANPESLSAEKLEVLFERGVGRLSLGLQASQDRLLSAIGRKHTFAQFVEVYGLARASGLRNVNVDLMFGLPEQSLADLEESLSELIELAPEHVSAYGLQVEDRTHFAKRGVENDDGLMREMHELVIDRLAEAGYGHYEISNFAKPGREALHNTLYWTGAEYRGFGCSASSYEQGRRWTNQERLDRYLKAVEAGEDAAEESEVLHGKARIGERVLLGLRMMRGLELTAEMEQAFAGDWQELGALGLVERRGRRVRLSREGVFVSNQVFQRFVAPFAHDRVPAAA